MQAAQNAAAPKTLYASATGPSAKGGGPAISGSVEAGKAIASIGLGGADTHISLGSAWVDTMVGSAETSGQPTSGMTVGAGASKASVNFGISNSTSAKDISNIPMTRLTIGNYNVGFGNDSKGNWAIEAGASMKEGPKLISFERPKTHGYE